MLSSTVFLSSVAAPSRSRLYHEVQNALRTRQRHRRISGTGTGLTLVRQIVEQHGGVVAVESQLERGTTFRLRLPLAAA